MHMDTSPIDSWEGVGAYFTFADQPGMVAFFCGLAVVTFLGFMYALIKHENDAFNKHEG
tara:strand:+ start:27182 stop:27358 length:177 start_codon:yes stop_codon:yes gene_type:complete